MHLFCFWNACIRTSIHLCVLDKPFKLATTYSLDSVSLKASIGLWLASNYGKDIIIGVVDSGIWPEQPSFKANGMPIGKVSTKWNGTCEGGQQFNSSMCHSKLIEVRYFNATLKEKIDLVHFRLC